MMVRRNMSNDDYIYQLLKCSSHFGTKINSAAVEYFVKEFHLTLLNDVMNAIRKMQSRNESVFLSNAFNQFKNTVKKFNIGKVKFQNFKTVPAYYMQHIMCSNMITLHFINQKIILNKISPSTLSSIDELGGVQTMCSIGWMKI